MLLTSPVEIELTTKCTLGCPACPRNDPFDLKENWDVGHLNTELIKSLANTSVDRKFLFIGCYGDPIYHPNLHGLLDVAIEEQVNLSIATNGFGKKDKWWDISYEKAAQIKKHRWIFGVDGLPKDSHKYRINQDGEAVFKQMVRGVKAGNNICWQYIVFSYNENDIDEARKMAEYNGIDFMLLESSRWYTEDDPLRPTKHFIDRIVGKEIEMNL